MSFRALIWAVDQNIDPLEKVVLVTLADHHNGQDGMCFPGLPLLVERTGMGLSTVKKKLVSLIERGLISRYRWGRTSAYVLAISGVEERPDPEAPSRRKRRANGPRQSPIRATTELNGLSQSREWALSEPHNQEANRESNQEGNPPRPPPSEIAVCGAVTNTMVEGILPENWRPNAEHVEHAMGECRATMNGIRSYMSDRYEWFPHLAREFATRWVEAKARDMRAWATANRRTSSDWDLRFFEWMRREFAALRRSKKRPFIIVDGDPRTLDEAINTTFYATRPASKHDPVPEPEFEAPDEAPEEDPQDRHEREKRQKEVKWWTDRATSFKASMTPEAFAKWVCELPEVVRDFLPAWCRSSGQMSDAEENPEEPEP